MNSSEDANRTLRIHPLNNRWKNGRGMMCNTFSTPPFSYEGYRGLLSLLISEGYEFSSYQSWSNFKKAAILRHDIDVDISKALTMALLEAEVGVSSVYYVLLRSDLYNFSSERNTAMLRKISRLGHKIGLHYDETVYSDENNTQHIIDEARVLSETIGVDIDSVSMHRPSQRCLEGNWQIPGLINSYCETFFYKPFKYLSDSRRHWREPILDIIKSGSYPYLHILTHAYWYNCEEMELEETMASYQKAALSRFEADLRQQIWLFGGFCGRDSGIGPAQRAKTTIWN